MRNSFFSFFFILFFKYFFLEWEISSCVPWAGLEFTSENDLKLLVLLGRPVPHCLLCSVEGQSRSFTHAKQTIYKLSYVPSPAF